MDVKSVTECLKIICIVYAFCLNIDAASGQRTKSIFNLLTVFEGMGPKMCERRCSQFSSCSAISYRRSDMYCELIKDEEEVQFVKDDNFMFSKAVDFQIDKNACWPNPCFAGQKCVIGMSGGSICVTHGKNLTKEDMNKIIKGRESSFQNVVRGKPTSQYPSSTNANDKADNAIDGDVTTYSSTAPFSSTQHAEIFWMIDLQDDFLVVQVDITNRNNNGHFLHDLDVTVGLNETEQELCDHFVGPGTNGQHIVLRCHDLIFGRFVKLTITKIDTQAFLQLAEVAVSK